MVGLRLQVDNHRSATTTCRQTNIATASKTPSSGTFFLWFGGKSGELGERGGGDNFSSPFTHLHKCTNEHTHRHTGGRAAGNVI